MPDKLAKSDAMAGTSRNPQMILQGRAGETPRTFLEITASKQRRRFLY